MKILKNWKKGLLAVLMVLCFSMTASAYTFDGDIDPIVFGGWEVLSFVQLSSYGGTVVVRNPDGESKILRVVVKVESGGIMGYGYTIDGHTAHGKTYVYLFNLDTENYDEFVE